MQIRIIKEKEFFDNVNDGVVENKENEEFYQTPQIFVNELFKFHKESHFDEQWVDDHVSTMIIGVSIHFFKWYVLITKNIS